MLTAQSNSTEQREIKRESRQLAQHHQVQIQEIICKNSGGDMHTTPTENQTPGRGYTVDKVCVLVDNCLGALHYKVIPHLFTL